MLSDIEIAQQAKMLKITEVAAKLGISEDDIELYGKYKAKLSMDLIQRMENEKAGKLILVTAITPTPAGEGKSPTTVGLAQGLAKIDKKVIYLIASALPFISMSSAINGYFTAVRRVYKNAIAKFFEEIIKIVCAVILLHIYDPSNLNDACFSLILADVISEYSSFAFIIILTSTVWSTTLWLPASSFRILEGRMTVPFR